jgi:hypothetical protein
MGLDMYLYGEKYLWTNWEDKSKNVTEDGFRLQTKILEVAYWRKHPNLHGFIIKNFADGVDECQRIELSHEDILRIIEAVKSDQLPPTSGFFFGESDGSEKDEDLKIFTSALEWMQVKEKGISRSVVYRASW